MKYIITKQLNNEWNDSPKIIAETTNYTKANILVYLYRKKDVLGKFKYTIHSIMCDEEIEKEIEKLKKEIE